MESPAPHPSTTPTPSELDAVRGRAPRWLVGFLILASLGFWAYLAWRPLEGPFRLGFQHHNAARYAIQGRNYVRHGFTENLLAPDYTPGARKPAAERALYLHHPPLTPLVVGASFTLLGENEKNAQLPFFVLGIFAPLAMFVLGRRVLRSGGAALAAAFVAIPPLGTIYGGHVDPQGPIVVISVILSTWAYVRFRSSRRASDLLLVAGFAAVGLLSDWSAAYPLGVIAFAETFLPGGTRDRRVWLLPLLPVGFFLAYLSWIEAMGRSPSVELFTGAGTRTLHGILRESGVDLFAALSNFGVNVRRMFTGGLLLLALVGAFVLLRARRDSSASDPYAGRFAFVVLVLSGVSHVLLFPQGALIHDYWTYLLLPPAALAAAAFVDAIRIRWTQSQGEGFGSLVVLSAVSWVALESYRETTSTLAAQEVGELPHALVGRATREQVRPHERVLTNLDYNPTSTRLIVKPEFTWYADRVARGAIATEADLDRALTEEGAFDWFVYAAAGTLPIREVLERRYGPPRSIQVPGGTLFFFKMKS